MLPIAILAGGFATRLGGLTLNYPKCLLAVNGRPFIDWQLDILSEAGYLDFVLCVSFKSELVKDYLGDGKNRGVQIHYSYDGEIQQGTGGAIRKALPLLGDEFGVIYGDSYLTLDYAEAEKSFLDSKLSAMMTVYANENNFDLSNVEFSDGIIHEYNKFTPSKNMHHIDYGLTYFRKETFLGSKLDEPFDLSITCQQLATERKLGGFEVFNRFYEIGSLQGINQFSDFLRKAYP